MHNLIYSARRKVNRIALRQWGNMTDLDSVSLVEQQTNFSFSQLKEIIDWELQGGLLHCTGLFLNITSSRARKICGGNMVCLAANLTHCICLPI